MSFKWQFDDIPILVPVTLSISVAPAGNLWTVRLMLNYRNILDILSPTWQCCGELTPCVCLPASSAWWANRWSRLYYRRHGQVECPGSHKSEEGDGQHETGPGCLGLESGVQFASLHFTALQASPPCWFCKYLFSYHQRKIVRALLTVPWLKNHRSKCFVLV